MKLLLPSRFGAASKAQRTGRAGAGGDRGAGLARSPPSPGSSCVAGVWVSLPARPWH